MGLDAPIGAVARWLVFGTKVASIAKKVQAAMVTVALLARKEIARVIEMRSLRRRGKYRR